MDQPTHRAAEGLPPPDWLPRRKLTVREYHLMGDIGILGEDDRVELIEGELIRMSPITAPHINCINALNRLLVLGAEGRAIVSVQNPVRLSNHTEPQPDFALLRLASPNYARTPPLAADVLLLVEVAVSSLSYDAGVKARLYAAAGIPEYWIVDVEARKVLLRRGPGEGGYAQEIEAREEAVLEPALLPGLRLSVAALLG